MTKIRSDFDLGGLLAFGLAAGMTGASLGMIIYNDAFNPLWAGLSIATCAAAWTAFWAWRRKSWPFAAAAFFVALAWPAGYAVELSGPITIGFVVVSLGRAWSDRPAKRKRRDALGP